MIDSKSLIDILGRNAEVEFDFEKDDSLAFERALAEKEAKKLLRILAVACALCPKTPLRLFAFKRGDVAPRNSLIKDQVLIELDRESVNCF